MAEFSFVIERSVIVKLQIAKIRNIRVIDEIIYGIWREFQAIFLGEAIIIGRKIRHVVFHFVEHRRKQYADRQTNESKRNEDSDKPRENRILDCHCKYCVPPPRINFTTMSF